MLFNIFERLRRLGYYLCPNIYMRRLTWLAVAVFGFVIAKLQLTRGKDPEGPEEPSGSEDEHPVENPPQEVDEEPRVVPLDGPGAAGKRTADPSRDPSPEPCKRLRTEDEEEDGEEFDSSDYRVEDTDELYCDYDSTWESSSASEPPWSDRPMIFSYHKFGRFKNAARDMQNYRHNYPHRISYQSYNQEHAMHNLQFYLGTKASSPDGIYINEFHTDWFGDYDRLEHVHTYIQWLFPLQEAGVNYEAWELAKEEIEAFLESSTAKDNLLESYKLMLDFYGIELCNVDTGEVTRAPNWKERFVNLNKKTHNNLRLTRILKCLGTLGFAHYQAPLVRFFLEQTLVCGILPNVKESVLNYFMFAVLDKRKRRNLIKFAYMNYEHKEEFVWCPKKIQMIWSAKAAVPCSDQPTEMKTQDGKGDANDHDVELGMDDLQTSKWDWLDPNSNLGSEESTESVNSS